MKFRASDISVTREAVTPISVQKNTHCLHSIYNVSITDMSVVLLYACVSREQIRNKKYDTLKGGGNYH